MLNLIYSGVIRKYWEHYIYKTIYAPTGNLKLHQINMNHLPIVEFESCGWWWQIFWLFGTLNWIWLICADYLCHCIDMLVVGLAPCHYLNQCWHTLTWTNFSGVHIKILTSFFIQERRLKISFAKRQPFCHSISLLDYENHRFYVSIQF